MKFSKIFKVLKCSYSKRILKVGDKATYEKTFTENDILEFSKLSGVLFYYLYL
jgi:hypothetical protein